MTDQQIIEAVLKSCGWKWRKPNFDHDGKWHTSLAKVDKYTGIFDQKWAGEPPPISECTKDWNLMPPILTSLDACHAVLPMKDEKFLKFVWDGITGISYFDRAMFMMNMTARDWCLAWLKFEQLEDKTK